MKRRLVTLLLAGLLVWLGVGLLSVDGKAFAADKYMGTDDMIDRKMQEVAGVSAGKPLIDLNQGNLGLFVFTVGGFAAGVCAATIGGRFLWKRQVKRNDQRQLPEN